MGDKKLRPERYFAWSLIVLAMAVLFIALVIIPSLSVDEPKRVVPHSDHKPVRSLVVKVIPVVDEPGAYVLEYNNGYVEVVHADGTREQLLIKPGPLPEENDELQPLRPTPTSGERSESTRTPD